LVGQPPCRRRSPRTAGDTFEPKRIVVSEQHSADNQPIYPYYAYVVTLHPTQSVQLFAQRRLQEAGGCDMASGTADQQQADLDRAFRTGDRGLRFEDRREVALTCNILIFAILAIPIIAGLYCLLSRAMLEP
jgi:hypothetical protein